MIEKLILTTQEEIRTMTDPYRIDIIQILRKHKNKPLTVKEIADIMNEPHGKVYYHVQKLYKFGAVIIEKTEKINGIVAKYYALNFETMEIQGNSQNDNNAINMNHAMSMINKFYDDSKSEFLNYVKNIAKFKEQIPGTKEEHTGRFDSKLQTTTLYFTEESYEAFTTEINRLIDEHTAEKKVEGEFEKAIFLTVYNEYKSP